MDVSSLKKSAVSKLKRDRNIYLASILEQMSITYTGRPGVVAYVIPTDGCTIFLGEEFTKYSREHQENILIHEARHIPQIAVKPFVDGTLSHEEVLKRIEDETLIGEFTDKKGPSYDRWKNKADNLGMDAESNEWLNKEGYELPDGCVYPGTLPKFCDIKAAAPDDGKEFGAYTQYAMDHLNPPEPPEQQEQQDGESQEGQGDGLSNLNPKDWEGVLPSMLDEAEKAVREYAEKHITYDGKDISMYGSGTGSSVETLKRGTVPTKLQKILESIRRRVRPRIEQGQTQGYTWGKVNKAYPTRPVSMGLLPGATDYDTKKSTKKVIVVLDSSGSCWDDRNFKLGMAVAHWYEQRHMLTALYCCDTELAKVEFGQKKSQIRGGGGTEFGKRHIKQLTDKHGEDYAIVYLTDGDLDLSDARAQKTVFIVDIVKEVEVA